MTQPIGRHDFLTGLARGSLLLGLGVVGAAALHGSRDPSECMNTGACSSCNVYKTCALPERKKDRDGNEAKA
jgi:hypothetical protein